MIWSRNNTAAKIAIIDQSIFGTGHDFCGILNIHSLYVNRAFIIKIQGIIGRDGDEKRTEIKSPDKCNRKFASAQNYWLFSSAITIYI